MKTRRPSGYVIYRGPSLLDGKPIVAIAITKSSNRKTGDIVQTYILVDNGELPVANYKSLADESICGDCPHRRGLGGACYVLVHQGPTMVYKAMIRGIYPTDLDQASKECAGRVVRMGTYGDPAAIPKYVWENLLKDSIGNTGYTHQWKQGKSDHIQEWCMASADSEKDRIQAKANGWRTFRIRTTTEELMAGEFVCPASQEAGYRKLCVECKACDGGVNTRKGDAAIIVHGNVKKRFRKFDLAVA
jgi:hypothetical protein